MSHCYTDYPITALGDRRGKTVPIRKIWIKRVCGSWCQIIINEPRIELHVEVPAHRVYCKPGRKGRAAPISASTIHRINNRGYTREPIHEPEHEQEAAE